MLNLAVTWVFVIPVITPTQLGRYLGIYIYIYNTSKLPVLDSAVTSWVYIEYRQLPILNSAVTWAYTIPVITDTQLGRYLGTNTRISRLSTVRNASARPPPKTRGNTVRIRDVAGTDDDAFHHSGRLHLDTLAGNVTTGRSPCFIPHWPLHLRR